MPSKSKTKGNSFEREFVKWLRARGYSAERAWGSDGRSRGWPESVDVEASRLVAAFNCGLGIWGAEESKTPCQLKRRAKLPNYLKIPTGADCVVFREDRGKTLVLMYAEDVWPEL